MKFLSLILSLLLVGCASFVSSVTQGHPNRKEIPIRPGGVAVMKTGRIIDSDRDGYVLVPRGNGAFRGNSGWLEEGGYQTANVRPWINPWIAGNWLYGGFPGLAGDFIGGGAYNPHVTYILPVSVK